jgi:CRISPR/Cas system-associated endoribonuclease Cas2
MALYIVSYDQHHDKDYTPVWALLRSWGAKRILESVWLVQHNGDAGRLIGALRQQTKDEDSLIILELKAGSDWVAFRAQDEGVKWLRAYILQ